MPVADPAEEWPQHVPTAANESEALICARLQPKVSSSGSMKTPKPYTPEPVQTPVAMNTAAAPTNLG